MAMEAGVDPHEYWCMMPSEIVAVIEGHRKRTKWDAVLTYTAGALFMCGVGIAISGGHFPTIQEVFPDKFPELDVPENPTWQIAKERILAHSNDYLKRGESA